MALRSYGGKYDHLFPFRNEILSSKIEVYLIMTLFKEILKESA